jgi:hypothetical protein
MRKPCGKHCALSHSRAARHDDAAIDMIFYQKPIKPGQQSKATDELSMSLPFDCKVDR